MKNGLAKLRHARSKKDFPGVKLEDDEYVELIIRRSKVVPILIRAGVVLSAFILVALIILMNASSNSGSVFSIGTTAQLFMSLIACVVFGAILIVAMISNHVYNGNILYVTNQRLIMQTATTLFTTSTNVIDLVSVEDVSFKQESLLDKVLRMGTLRMSTISDETTYTFKDVDTPVDELETIIHLVHAQKDKDDEDSDDRVRREVRREVDRLPEAIVEDVVENDVAAENDEGIKPPMPSVEDFHTPTSD